MTQVLRSGPDQGLLRGCVPSGWDGHSHEATQAHPDEAAAREDFEVLQRPSAGSVKPDLVDGKSGPNEGSLIGSRRPGPAQGMVAAGPTLCRYARLALRRAFRFFLFALCFLFGFALPLDFVLCALDDPGKGMLGTGRSTGTGDSVKTGGSAPVTNLTGSPCRVCVSLPM
jgi:hypothetical protein